MDMKKRSGIKRRVGSGHSSYECFVPSRLDSNHPKIDYDQDLVFLLSEANVALSKLDENVIHKIDHSFINLYAKKESSYSSQIEGTLATFSDLLKYEVGIFEDVSSDVDEIKNYIDALNYGLERLETLPLSLRLIKEMHAILLTGVRGMHKSPGEFRHSQNWVGGSQIQNAQYVPPSINYLDSLLSNLEIYIHQDDKIPTLIKAAIIHVHFEMIHPFLDGNGRMGRLLIIFYLMNKNVIHQPILYLSKYFMLFRNEYYECLKAINETSDYEKWIKFFLEGIIAISDDVLNVQNEISKLKENDYLKINQQKNNKRLLLKCLDLLIETPIVCSLDIQNKLNISKQSSSRLIKALIECDIIQSVNSDKRNIRYAYFKYIDLFMH